MAKKKKKLIKLTCSECKRINYYYWNPRHPEQKKFCKWCRKHMVHREVKKR